MKMMIN